MLSEKLKLKSNESMGLCIVELKEGRRFLRHFGHDRVSESAQSVKFMEKQIDNF